MITSLSILGKRHSVRVIEESALESRLRGHIDHHKAEIYVLGGMDEQVTQESVLHELLHGLESALGLDFEEHEIEALSRGLWATAQESPEAVAWMLGLKP